MGLLTGCASDSYWGARANVVQNKFDHLTCEQLDSGATRTQAQITELTGLQDKAAGETPGTAIGAVVYGPTLAQARGNLRIYQETREAKKCAVGGARPLY
jgi:hypothetical protein